MRLTERSIKAIAPPATGKLRIADEATRGLYLIVTAQGKFTFALRYHRLGRERLYTIGAWPDWSATMARDEAEEIRRKIAKGLDPLDDRRQERTGQTFRELAELFLARYASKKRTGDRDREILHREPIRRWGARKVDEIKRADVRALFEAKSAAAPIGANRMLSCLSKLFNWALERDLVEVNPCAGIKRNPESAKARVLDGDEIRVVWDTLSAPLVGMSDQMRAALRLILLTGQRPGEIAGMRCSELKGDWWTIPAERAKNGVSQRVPLLPLAKGIVDEACLNAKTGATAVFRAGTRGGESISVGAMSHAVRRSTFVDGEGKPLAPWTPHDLRRTAATHMAAGGVAPHVVECLLNHTPAGVTRRHYNLWQYDDEKRGALARWECKLKELLSRDRYDPRLLLP